MPAAAAEVLPKLADLPSSVKPAAEFGSSLRTHFPSVTESVDARCRGSAEDRGYSRQTVADAIVKHGDAVMAGLRDRQRRGGLAANPEVFVAKALDQLDELEAEANAATSERTESSPRARALPVG